MDQVERLREKLRVAQERLSAAVAFAMALEESMGLMSALGGDTRPADKALESAYVAVGLYREATRDLQRHLDYELRR